MNDTHSKVWLITGCSSGFGRILAEMALARGDRVIATARKIEPLADLGAGSAGQLLTLALDVTDPASIAAVMAQAEAAFGRVDVLVNNAGFGLVGAVEELQPNEYRPMFETNLFGLIEVTRGALPSCVAMAAHASSTCRRLAVSPGGRVSAFTMPASLRSKGCPKPSPKKLPLWHQGDHRRTGAFRTAFLGRSIAMGDTRLAAYEATSGATRDFSAANDGVQLGDPRKGMAVLMQAILAERPPLRLPLGRDALARIDAKLAAVSADLAAWRGLAEQTSHGEPGVP
jgi:NAD(P)-dependent dehydrogenase (short-subunit alcohol dehydrogenase family)